MNRPNEQPDRLVREFPSAQHEWLRFQVGRMETRPEQIPSTAAGKTVGFRDGPPVKVFRLLGFGPTLAEAETMAKRAASKV